MERSLKFHPTPKSSTPQHTPETTLPERVSRRAIRDRIAPGGRSGILRPSASWARSCDGHFQPELCVSRAGFVGWVCIARGAHARFAKVRVFCSLAQFGRCKAIRYDPGFRATETIENNKVELEETFHDAEPTSIENRDRSSVPVSNGRRFRPWRPGRSGFDPGE
jgi:hypothetical protein